MADEHDLGAAPKGGGQVDFVGQFLESRRANLSHNTFVFYSRILVRAAVIANPWVTPPALATYVDNISGSPGNRHAHYRALRTFFRWLFSPRSGLGFNPQRNPMSYVDAPKVPKRILPSLTTEDIDRLLDEAKSVRDRAIIVFLTESGLRVSELASIRLCDIDWNSRTVRVIGKGNKEGLAPFGERTERCLRLWLEKQRPAEDVPLWGVAARGVQQMLESLSRRTGLPCNPHTFRRTFASLLRKAGVDVLTIKQLGRWESIEMVERYTRSVTFADSLRLYRAPLG